MRSEAGEKNDAREDESDREATLSAVEETTVEETTVEAGDHERDLRGEFFAGLDLLAFALEMETAELVEVGDEEGARRLENQRLGVRLAQRYVSGVSADEVDLRMQEWEDEYRERTTVA